MSHIIKYENFKLFTKIHQIPRTCGMRMTRTAVNFKWLMPLVKTCPCIDSWHLLQVEDYSFQALLGKWLMLSVTTWGLTWEQKLSFEVDNVIFLVQNLHTNPHTFQCWSVWTEYLSCLTWSSSYRTMPWIFLWISTIWWTVSLIHDTLLHQRVHCTFSFPVMSFLNPQNFPSRYWTDK